MIPAQIPPGVDLWNSCPTSMSSLPGTLGGVLFEIEADVFNGHPEWVGGSNDRKVSSIRRSMAWSSSASRP